MNEKLKAAIEDVHFWLSNPNATNFNTFLLRLILKADRENLDRLMEIYPDHCEAMRLWKQSI